MKEVPIKKHIIIAGASRSGKTTLAIKLRELGYNHYKLDSIKRGIYGNFVKDTNSFEEISYRMSKLIRQIIIDNDEDTDGENQFYVMDSCSLVPDDTLRLLRLNNVIVIYLNYTDISTEDKIKEVMKYDQKGKSWSKKLDEKELRKLIHFHIFYSHFINDECRKNNIPVFDTSHNRDTILNDIYRRIKNKEI